AGSRSDCAADPQASARRPPAEPDLPGQALEAERRRCGTAPRRTPGASMIASLQETVTSIRLGATRERKPLPFSRTSRRGPPLNTPSPSVTRVDAAPHAGLG